MSAIERAAWGPQGYAGFWQRVGGSVVDALLFFLLLVAVSLGVLLVGAAAGEDPFVFAGEAGGTVQVFVLLSWLLYDTVLTARQGATLGKRAAGIEVRRPDGTLPSPGVCVGRAVGRALSVFPLFGLPFLWSAFDPRKRALHDLLLSTVVVQRAALRPAGPQAAPADDPPRWSQAAPADPPRWSPPGPAPSASPASPAAPPAVEPGWRPAGVDAGSSPAGSQEAADRSVAPPGTVGEGGTMLSGATLESARWGPRSGDAAAPPPSGPAPSAAAPPPSGPVPSGAGPAEGLDAAGQGASRWERPEPPPADEVSPESSEPSPAAMGSPVVSPAGAAAPEPASSEVSRADEASSEPPPAGQRSAEATPGGAAPRPDPNRVAIERARLDRASASWLAQIAGQVDARLDRVDPQWRRSPQAEAARACAFGIFLGHLSRLHPHMSEALGKVAEVHPSFSTLLAGSRLATLQQIAEEPARATAWLGPLLDVEDRQRIARLLD